MVLHKTKTYAVALSCIYFCVKKLYCGASLYISDFIWLSGMARDCPRYASCEQDIYIMNTFILSNIEMNV